MSACGNRNTHNYASCENVPAINPLNSSHWIASSINAGSRPGFETLMTGPALYPSRLSWHSGRCQHSPKQEISVPFSRRIAPAATAALMAAALLAGCGTNNQQASPSSPGNDQSNPAAEGIKLPTTRPSKGEEASRAPLPARPQRLSRCQAPTPGQAAPVPRTPPRSPRSTRQRTPARRRR